jgi:hypothetical protein
VTAENDNTLTIMDLTNPQNPIKLAEIVNGAGGVTALDLPTGVLVDGTNLYVLGFLSSSLAIFDVSTPASPRLQAQIFDDSAVAGSPFTKLKFPYSMKLVGHRLYIAARGDSAITIVDVSNPAAPQLLAEIVDDSVNPSSPFHRLANVNSVDVVGNILYAVSGAFAGPDASLTIIDVSDPANPVRLAEVSDDSIDSLSRFTGLRGAWGITVTGNTAFVTSFSDNTLTAIDVSNPSSPRLLKQFTQGVNGLTTFGFPEGLAATSSALYVVGDSSAALDVLDLRSTLGLKVDSAVGIGTATPRSALDVAGTIRSTDLLVDNAIGARDFVADNSVTAGGFGNFGSLVSRSTLAIGTSNPVAPLHIVSANNNLAFLDGSSSIGTWFTLGNRAGGLNWNFISTGTNNGEGPGKLLLSPGSTFGTVNYLGRFVVDTNGNLGLGTFNPTAPLHVQASSGIEHVKIAAAPAAPFGAFLSLDASATTGGKKYLIYSTGNSAGEGQGKLVFQNNSDGILPMCITSNGNVGIGNLSPTNTFVVVNARCDGSTWINSSDRNLKEDFAPVDPRSVLDKVTALPVQTWSYKAQPGQKHIGPVAQDFHAAFGLGADATSISTVDADGVALAAIQGLNQKLEAATRELRTQLEAKDKHIAEMQARLERLESVLARSGLATGPAESR